MNSDKISLWCCSRYRAMRALPTSLLQAAIASLHAEAPSVGGTDWAQIIALYDVLCRVDLFVPKMRFGVDAENERGKLAAYDRPAQADSCHSGFAV
jgi:hypothetical protein